MTGGGSLHSASGSIAHVEPSIDFELDIKVGIDSGKCVLHPKEPKTESEAETKRFVKL